MAVVAVSMQKSIQSDVQDGKAGWNCGEILSADEKAEDRYIPVCVTLGPGVDALQESYLQQGLLTEAYMVENLAGELLLRAYPLWNEWVVSQGSPEKELHVRRYHFPGSEDGCPLEKLPELLKKLDIPVTCTEAYCLLPKKSVAFYAELTRERNVRCEGICVGCGRKDCPNRMEREEI